MPAWVSSATHRAIIAALVNARGEAGLTQRDRAARLGKPPSFVGNGEAVERNLGVLEFVEWTEALGVSGSDLLATVRLAG